uniref:Eukaryotic translation initiation factor 3 subunit C n=1 Tax=Eucampia antarctica TaxID=49252 RepID=A0A7S2R1T0_9STRA|mmetsp:Transcript_13516/g.13093  ORF Transcript_13516/g.13093 Transcript_13516/m.13093 type:complete len:1048 (+) Transcript_13516:77-3220(+)
MSRFWAAGGSSSDSDSSSDDSSIASSNDSGARNENRWVFDSDSDSDESEVREVKSAKERAMVTLRTHIKGIKAGMKSRNYVDIQTDFKAMDKTLQKNLKVLEGVPRMYVRMLVELQDDYLPGELGDKARFKKLSSAQGRALNGMKLALRKQSKTYGKLMDNYRENPVLSDVESEADSSDSDSDDDSDSDSDSDSDDEEVTTAVAKKVAAVVSDSDSNSDSDSDSDSDSGSDSGSGIDSDKDWGSSSDSSSSSDDEDNDKYAQLKGRARWLISNTVVKEKVKKDKEGRAQARKQQAQKKNLQMEDERLTTSKSVLVNANPTLIDNKVKELMSQRGRKGTDNKFILRQLEALSKISTPFGPRVEVPLLMYVITAQFDLIRTLDDYMDTTTWRSCATYLNRVTSILQNDNYTLGSAMGGDDDLGDSVALMGKMKNVAKGTNDVAAMDLAAAEEKLINPHTGEQETKDERAERLRLEKEAAMTPEELSVIPVVGSLSLLITRLDEEYTKSLQRISPHSAEYVGRLKDEAKLLYLLKVTQGYFLRLDSLPEAAEVAQLRVEHLYYRHDTIAVQVDRASKFYDIFGDSASLHPSCLSASIEATDEPDYSKFHPGAALGKPSVAVEAIDAVEDNQKIISDLCTMVYQHGTDRSKTRAMLCQIYHNALHDRFLEARDLLLMSHLQDNISQIGDVSTMILFNRMMATMGLAAFRLGKIWDAHQCLSDICSGRVRELLAQGVSTGRFSDKTPDQEKAEKRRQTAYHLHIHLELLEACHLISAMLLEVPHMVVRRARVISRSFRKHYDMYDRQVFCGPPEQTRDYVMLATKALMHGDWKTCADLVCNLDVWKLVPGDNVVSQIQDMLKEKIKLEGLRTYLFAFSSQYDSMSLSQLCDMFDLSKVEVHSVVSKMLMNREIYASWDQPTETIVLRHTEPSSLQLLALQFAEKAANLVDANERLLDAKSGYNLTGGNGSGDRDGRWNGDRSNNNQGRYQNRGYQQGGGRHGGYNNGRGGGRGRGGRGRGGRGRDGGGRGRDGGGRQNRNTYQNNSRHRGGY